MENKDHAIEDPFAHLEEDHKKVSAVFKDMCETSNRAVKTREDLCEQLTDLLTRHSELEKHILYPKLEAIKNTHDITLEGYEEHKVIETLLEELGAMEADTDEWMAKLTVLQENVEHHVKEEESDMFPKARKALGKEEQEALCSEMEDFLMSEDVPA